MSRTLSTSFTNTLAGLTMGVVELYKISATGMSTFLYTDSNTKVSYAGLTYDPYPIKRSKISFSSDLKVDQTNLTFAKSWGLDNAIVKDVFSGSDVQITRVNLDLPDTDNLLLFDGEVSDFQLDELNATVRCQTLDFLNLELPKREHQTACNWSVYDTFCGLTIADWTESHKIRNTNRNFLISTTLAGTTFDDTLGGIVDTTFEDQYWRGGFIKSTSGANDQLIRHITNHVGVTVNVLPPFPFDFVEDTDTFDSVPGCDHSITDCEDKFNNLINYGGFPFIPNQDSVI